MTEHKAPTIPHGIRSGHRTQAAQNTCPTGGKFDAAGASGMIKFISLGQLDFNRVRSLHG